MSTKVKPVQFHVPFGATLYYFYFQSAAHEFIEMC